MKKTKSIKFSGQYWWSDSGPVISILQEELHEALSRIRVGRIEISGTDFNDGRQSRKAIIEVSDGNITVSTDFV